MDSIETVKKKVLLPSILALSPDGLKRRMAAPYLAGETLEHAMEFYDRELVPAGLEMILDILGEGRVDDTVADQFLSRYLHAVETVPSKKDISISVKLSSLGLPSGICTDDISYQTTKERLEILLAKAKEHGRFVRIDMENRDRFLQILQMYLEVQQRFEDVGTVLQAYCRALCGEIIPFLAPYMPNIRLCKGIYDPPEDFAFKDPNEIRDNFKRALRLLLNSGATVAVATHDDALVEDALTLAVQRFEFLKGVKPALAVRTALQGKEVGIYAPYGPWEDARPYAERRFKERPAILKYVIKNAFRREAGDNYAQVHRALVA